MGLGISHAHLSLGQIENSEKCGPRALVRMAWTNRQRYCPYATGARLGISKASYCAMPESSKQWAAGLNYVVACVASNKALRPEAVQIRNVRPTVWTEAELLTLARLNCADFT